MRASAPVLLHSGWNAVAFAFASNASPVCLRLFAHAYIASHLLTLATLPGGDLQLVSMPGYGVDAFLSLQHLEGDWQEPLAEHQSAPFEAEQAPLSAYP